MLHSRQWARPLLSWFGGNIAWGIATVVFTKVAKDSAMIEAIGLVGFLVLIISGLAYINLRDRGGATPTTQYENMARYVTAMYFSQQYDVKPKELLDMVHPQAMEEKAKRLQIEARLQQPAPTPSTADTAGSPK